MTDRISYLITEARKLGLTEHNCRCIKAAHGILSEKEIIKALEKFIDKQRQSVLQEIGQGRTHLPLPASKIENE